MDLHVYRATPGLTNILIMPGLHAAAICPNIATAGRWYGHRAVANGAHARAAQITPINANDADLVNFTVTDTSPRSLTIMQRGKKIDKPEQ